MNTNWLELSKTSLWRADWRDSRKVSLTKKILILWVGPGPTHNHGRKWWTGLWWLISFWNNRLIIILFLSLAVIVSFSSFSLFLSWEGHILWKAYHTKLLIMQQILPLKEPKLFFLGVPGNEHNITSLLSAEIGRWLSCAGMNDARICAE